MTTNRIDEILEEIKSEVSRRRETGAFGQGYEAGIEDTHNLELGKVPSREAEVARDLTGRLDELRARIRSISAIERDRVKFAPIRFVRELAMSRHQLIRLSSEMKAVAESIENLVSEIVATETTRTNANERAAQDLLDLVYERTLVMERLVVVSRELEERLSRLEQR